MILLLVESIHRCEGVIAKTYYQFCMGIVSCCQVVALVRSQLLKSHPRRETWYSNECIWVVEVVFWLSNLGYIVYIQELC